MTPTATRRSDLTPSFPSRLGRTLAALAVPALAHAASATVSTTLVADTYLVTDNGHTYSVLDVYVTGTHLGDVVSSVTGLNGTAGHPVIFATSLATGTGLTRDADGRITAGTITNDVFVQAGNSSWLPTYAGAGDAWDSFVTVGARKQVASVTNRAGVKKVYDASTILGGIDFSQLGVANARYVNNGGGSGWYSTLGANPYSTAGTSEVPFVRLSIYNATWNAAYPDLDRTGRLLTLGKKQTGRTSAGASAAFTGDVGSTLDFCFMVGRFTIDATGMSPATPPTMQVQFNVVGKNGTGNETGTTFSGATTVAYKLSQFFTFAVPAAPPSAPTGVAASDGTSSSLIHLAWNSVGNATSYQIYRFLEGGTPEQIGTSATNAYDDSTADPAILYFYKVKAVNGSGASSLSASDTGWRGLPTTTGVVASDGTNPAGVGIAWNEVPGATGYKLLRASAGATPAEIGTAVASPFVDTTAVPGRLYLYGVAASCGLGDSPAGTDSGWRTLAVPATLTASDGTESLGVVLNWTESPGAIGYKVFRGLVTPDSLLATVGAVTTFTDATAVPGMIYQYAVRATGDGTGDTAASPTDAGWRSMPAPVSVVASGGTNPGAVVLGWGAVPGVATYKVYRSIGDAAGELIATVETNAYSDTSAQPGVLYTYRVRASAPAGDGPASAAFTGWRGIAAPEGVAASDGTSTTNVVVSWTGTAGAVGYKIFRGSGGAPSQIGTVTGGETTSFTDATASPGTLYTYAVRATGAVGTGDGAMSTTDGGYRGLSAPTALTASDGISGSGITLSWTASTGATGYKVMRATGDGAPAVIANVATTTYADNAVAAGTVYRYAVVAKGVVGVADSAASETDTGWRAVAVPSSLVATDGTSTAAVALTWTGSGGSSYKIFRALGDAGAEQIGTSAVASYSDATAVPGKVYRYSVRAVTPGADTAASTPDTGWRRLLPPSTFAASDGTSPLHVALSWTLPSGSVTAVKVYRAVADGTPSVVATLGGDATAYLDTSALPGTLYSYAVAATGDTGTGDSEKTAVNTGWRALSPPSNLNASDGTSAAAVILTWTGSPGAVSYRVLRATGADAPVELATVAAPAATYSDTTAEPGVVYNYALQANGGAGTGSSPVSASNSGWRSSPAPTGVLAGDGTSTAGVVITWTGVPGATSYKVFRATSATAPVMVGSSATTGYTDASAAPGVLYTYTVRTVTSGGDGATSAPDNGWRNMVPPAGVSATDGTRLQDVTVTWNATAGAGSYKVMRATGDGAPAVVGTVASSILRFADATATPGTLYRYTVRATGSVGTGDSEPSAVNTGWRAITAPTNLIASDGTSTAQVSLTWTAQTGAASYKIFRTGVADPIGTSPTNAYADTTAVPGVAYTYIVKAAGATGTGDSAASAPDVGWRAPQAPTEVVASDGATTAGVQVTWSAVDGARGYKVLRAAPGATASVIATSIGASFTDSTALPGVLYTYSVQTGGVAGDGAPSATDTGWRNMVAPSGISASDGASTAGVTVTWGASAGAAGYKVLRSVGGGVQVTVGTVRTPTLTYTDGSAVAGTVYTYTVKAVGNAGTGESLAGLSNTGYAGLSAPGSVAATDGTSTASTTITWNAVVGAARYKVFRGAAQVAITEATTFADTLGAAGMSYAYTVRAVGGAGVADSASSAPDNGWRNLPAPAGLVASDAITSKVVVTWGAVTGSNGYFVYRGTAPDSLARINGGVAVAGTTFNDVTAVAGTTYYYAVTARSPAGESARSAIDSGIRPSSFGPSGLGALGGDGSGGAGHGPDTTGTPADPAASVPMGLQRYLLAVSLNPDAAVACEATVETAEASLAGDAVTEDAAPEATTAFIDLDGNGQPDRCQLRQGDLDLSGAIDAGDLAVLLTMVGEEPPLGIGDLDGDGVVDTRDVEILTALLPAPGSTTP